MLRLAPRTTLHGKKELSRIAQRRAQQDYDPDPPRCGTCLYFTLGPWSKRAIEAKKGRGIEHLQRCTFGDFHTQAKAVCDEWRDKSGERLADTGASNDQE